MIRRNKKRLISIHNKAGTKEVREKNRRWHLGRKNSPETIAKRKKSMNKVMKTKAWKDAHHKGMLGLQNALGTKDSKPERMVQQMLKANDIQYQTHYPIIGQPDLFVKPSVCIFVDGCYWHGCKKCHPKIWEKYRQIYEQIMYDNEITPNNVEVAKNVIKIIGMARS